MKVNEQPPVKDPYAARWMREVATQVNLLSEQRLQASSYTATSVASAGPAAQGDFLKNSAPAELGTVGSKYVIAGWLCVAGGDPATWVQCRFLTGG